MGSRRAVPRAALGRRLAAGGAAVTSIVQRLRPAGCGAPGTGPIYIPLMLPAEGTSLGQDGGGGEAGREGRLVLSPPVSRTEEMQKCNDGL